METSEHIAYISGGLLGDFIHQLSVVNELFIITGKKGILYIACNGDLFRKGVEHTYHDIWGTISKQPYIDSFKIFNNQKFDIDLTVWRTLTLRPGLSWTKIFSDCYNIDWGANKWLHSENSNMNNHIIISTSTNRWNYMIDYKQLLSHFNDPVIFLCCELESYNFFKDKSGVIIPYHLCKDFTELVDMISGCKLFIFNSISQ